MKATVLGIVASILIIVPTASATPQCEPVSELANRMLPEEDTTAFLTGVNVSLILALTPSTFPQKQIDENTEACDLEGFVSDNIRYSMFGSDSEIPHRWAKAEGSNRIAYLAIAPLPHVALDWYNQTGGRGSLEFDEPPIYIAAITNGTSRDVYAFFYSLPSDEQITQLFQASLAGDLKRLLQFDTKTNNMEITSNPEDW